MNTILLVLRSQHANQSDTVNIELIFEFISLDFFLNTLMLISIIYIIQTVI